MVMHFHPHQRLKDIKTLLSILNKVEEDLEGKFAKDTHKLPLGHLFLFKIKKLVTLSF